VLDVSEDSVTFVSGLLDAERVRRGTRTGTRSLTTRQQAVLVLRWLFDDTRMTALAHDNAISVSTAYDYRDETIAVLAARKPSLRGALLAAKTAGHTHVILDGTLIPTDRISTPGPTRGVDLWWSGKHRHHGGNIQVVSAPDGWPLWTSPVRPGREHDTTAARADPDLLTQLTAWVDDGQLGLADLGYEGEAHILRIPIKKPAGGELSHDQQAYNTVHGALRALGERANSLLKTSFKALRRWRGCPWRIGEHRRRRPGPAPPRTPPNDLIPPAITVRDHRVARKGSTDLMHSDHRHPGCASVASPPPTRGARRSPSSCPACGSRPAGPCSSTRCWPCVSPFIIGTRTILVAHEADQGQDRRAHPGGSLLAHRSCAVARAEGSS
jgi:hypothetical protein